MDQRLWQHLGTLDSGCVATDGAGRAEGKKEGARRIKEENERQSRLLVVLVDGEFGEFLSETRPHWRCLLLVFLQRIICGRPALGRDTGLAGSHGQQSQNGKRQVEGMARFVAPGIRLCGCENLQLEAYPLKIAAFNLWTTR